MLKEHAESCIKKALDCYSIVSLTCVMHFCCYSMHPTHAGLRRKAALPWSAGQLGPQTDNMMMLQLEGHCGHSQQVGCC